MQKTGDDIITLALALSRHMRRMAVQSQAKGGTNMMRSLALTSIKETPNMTMSDFAKAMKISGSSATTFVDSLCKEKWVKRVADTKNRKIVHIVITPLGEKALTKNILQKRTFLSGILTLIPVADQKHLHRILTNLTESLNHLPAQ